MRNQKCSRENGMIICYCGKCKPELYELPKDLGTDRIMRELSAQRPSGAVTGEETS